MGNKYSNNLNQILALALISLFMYAPLFPQEKIPVSQKKPSTKTPQKKESSDFLEQNKIAQNDYKEKLYGQALESFQKILTTMKKDLSADQINNIKLKMAHCQFELGQYYKSTLLTDPFLGIEKLPLEFQNDNFESSLITIPDLILILKTPPIKGIKPITDLFPHLLANDDLTKEFLVEAFNKILNSTDSCKKVINVYGNIKEWKNSIIFQIPKTGIKLELKMLTRLILEALYPLNSYMNNQIIPDESTKNEPIIAITKDNVFFEALYWRSRINLETNYFSFAKSGFEEILTNLNFREIEKNINCLFYKSKAKFYLNQYKIALKEFEDLNALYSTDEYYKANFYDETYYLLGRCFFELSKFDKAIQKFVSITAGFDNREPRNKLVRSAYYWLGESYYCKGLLNEAIKSYDVIINYGTYEEKEAVMYSLGWANYEKGDRASQNKAKEQFELLLSNYPNTDYRLKTELKLAEIEIEEGHADRAEKIIADLNASTDNGAFLIKNSNLIKQTDFLIGLLYFKKKDFNKALTYFKRSEDTLDLKLKQKVNIQCGICYKELGDFKKAITYFTLASEITVSRNLQIIANSYVADTYFGRRTNQADLEIAGKIYDDLINDNPNHNLNIEWRKKKANVLRQQNLEDEAISTLNKILEENQSEWESAQLEIGNILMSTSPQRFSAAATHYKSIIDKIKNKEKKEESLLNFGICLLKIHQRADAISVFQNLIQESANENTITDAYQYQAMCFEEEKEIKKSLKILEESLLKFPKQKNHTYLHKECVRLYQLDQDIESAIKHLNIVYSEITDPNGQAEVLYQLAGFDLKNGTPISLENALQKLINIVQNYSISPSAPKAAYLIGKLYISKKNFSEALPYFEKIIKDYSDTEMTLLSLVELGNYYYFSGEFNKANDYYKKINFPVSSEQPKKYDSLRESVLMNLADSHFQLKDYQTAKDEYMGLIRLNHENSFYKIRYAKSCLESKLKIVDAISILEKIPRRDQTKETELLLDQLKDLQAKIRR